MILVTGAGGHLGANLLRRLCGNGRPIRASLLNAREFPAVEGLDVEPLIGDLSDPKIAAAAVKGCDHIYHCAGRVSTDHRNPTEIFRANLIVTREMLRAALRQGVERVVVTGSFSTVGINAEGPSNEDQPFDPLDRHVPYAHAKAAVEQECLKAHADGLSVVIANPTAILGPYDFKPSLLGQVLIRFAAKRLHAAPGGGFACVGARDIAQGLVLAMEKGRSGQRYIFDSGYLSFDDLMHIFSYVTGQPKPRFRIPPAILSSAAGFNDVVMRSLRPHAERVFTSAAVRFMQREQRADTSKAQRELGFKPTCLVAAVQEAYDWFVSRGMIKAQKSV